jgi:hypothetical protein
MYNELQVVNTKLNQAEIKPNDSTANKTAVHHAPDPGNAGVGRGK